MSCWTPGSTFSGLAVVTGPSLHSPSGAPFLGEGADDVAVAVGGEHAEGLLDLERVHVAALVAGAEEHVGGAATDDDPIDVVALRLQPAHARGIGLVFEQVDVVPLEIGSLGVDR